MTWDGLNPPYSTIVADPPWHFDERILELGVNRRTASMPYSTMTVEEIAALPVVELADRSAHLFLWTTNQHLWASRDVVLGWGFEPVQVLVWAKPPAGLGPGGLFANTSEFVVYARRTIKEKRKVERAGRLIQQAREEAGLNRSELHRRVRGGVPTGIVFRWEDDDSLPNERDWERLCEVLPVLRSVPRPEVEPPPPGLRMRVAYVGNFDAPHSTENHVARALENLGHSVERLPEQRMDWPQLPELVADADMMLWTRTAGFDPPDLEEQGSAIKSLRVPTVGFHLDRWVGLNREPDVHRSPFFRVDHLFTADGGNPYFWIEHGINHHWSPPAVLSDEAKRVGVWRQEYAVDVAFVGNLRRYGHPEWGPYRQQLYRFLAQTYKGRFRVWEGGIRGQDLADLYSSVKVLIGDSCLAGGIGRYWSDRIPETLGRGGFLIHPEVEGLNIDYPYLPLYHLGDFQRLRELIDYYLDHEQERQDIAAQNRQWVLDHHLYEHRMERVLATVVG